MINRVRCERSFELRTKWDCKWAHEVLMMSTNKLYPGRGYFWYIAKSPTGCSCDVAIAFNGDCDGGTVAVSDGNNAWIARIHRKNLRWIDVGTFGPVTVTNTCIARETSSNVITM